MNRRTLQEIVKGEYGRKVAYTDVEQITEQNIVAVVGSCIGILNRNREIIKYLWDYKKGDQPVLYREKTVRDDINFAVVENHAWEIVQFKNAQTNGEPIQCVSTRKDKAINNAVDKFNDYCRAADKYVKDMSSGEWTSAVGTGFKAVQRTGNSDIPFRIVTPSPMNTFIIYQRSTEEPLLAVQQLKDINGNNYLLCFDEIYEYRIQNGSLLTLETLEGGIEVKKRLHAFGGIPIVEYPNNQDRISDIELVISMLDAVNEFQSNRVDAVAQFVQSWIKFVNCDIDEETFEKMKMKGTLVVKSNNGSENKADVDIMTQELNQTQTQVAKEDLWNNVLSISAIPNRESQNSGGDTAGAVQLRAGFDFSKQRAKIKDLYIIASEKRLDNVILNVIRQSKGVNECNLTRGDFDVQISHSPTDNMLTKTQTLQLLLQAGIHPLIAIKTSGLWADSEKVFLQSEKYLNMAYKELEQSGEVDVEAQEKLANQIAQKQFPTSNK